MNLLIRSVACILLSMTALAACQAGEKRMSNATSVSVKLLDANGRLAGPFEVPRVRLSEAEWRARLTPEQYRILRQSGTEAPGTCELLDVKEPGVFVCAGCNLPLFDARRKFESGTGWPSFFQPIAEENIGRRLDTSHGMVRTEVFCPRCEGHLGHVFEDGPPPTGLRYCINGEAMKFVKEADVGSLAEAPAGYKTLVLAGGCFWCTEAVYQELDGVIDVVSGYAGGDAATANYKAVSTGKTGHAEAIRITYDPAKVRLEQLFEIFFTIAHDPTQLNRQGEDIGPQYRSAVFYADEEQKAAAQAYIRKLEAGKVFDKPIVTTLEPLEQFYEAEEYHQDYASRNPEQGYIRAVAQPKVEKLRRKMPPERLKSPAGSK